MLQLLQTLASKQEFLCWVARVGLPRCVATLIQEAGRNSRKGEAGTLALFTDWRLFIKLLLSILLPSRLPSSDEIHDHEYVNSMITPRSPEGRDSNRSSDANATNTHTAPLSQYVIRNNVVQAYKDLIDVVNFTFMPGFGCIHLRKEWYLHLKHVVPLPDVIIDVNADGNEYARGACKNCCYVCNGNYKKYMLPIVHAGALEFLSSSLFSDQMPYDITNADCEGMPNILWESKDMRKKVFGVATVDKHNVYSFFFQLIAAKMLEFTWASGEGVRCAFVRDANDNKVYNDKAKWEGFTFRTSSHGGKQYQFIELLK